MKHISQRCVATIQSGKHAGKRCWNMATRYVGGIAVCDFHVGYANKLFAHVCETAESDARAAHCVDAAIRDTAQVNAFHGVER